MSKDNKQAPSEAIPPVIDPGAVEPTEEIPPTSIAEPHRHAHGQVAARTDPADERLTNGRLAGLSMNKAIAVVVWPVLCESVLNSTIAAADAWLATHISSDAADAVAAAAYVLWFFGLIAMAIGVGATALVSRSVGAGRPVIARAALGQAVLLAAVGGVCTALLVALSAPAMAGLFKLNAAATHDFIAYIRGYCVGVPFSTILIAGSACLRGSGDTFRPLSVMVVVNIVNVFAAFLYSGVSLTATGADGVTREILANPSGLALGAHGIGLGTATAHFVGAAIIMWLLMRGREGMFLSWRWLKLHRITMFRLVRLGSANLVEMVGMWIVNMGVVLMVSWMNAVEQARAVAAKVGAAAGGMGGASPEAAVAAGGGLLGSHLLSIRVEAFSFLVGFAMGIAASTLTGQYLGAGKPQHARRAAIKCATLTGIFMGAAGIVLILLGGPLVRIISPQAEHHLIAPQLLFITGFTQAPMGVAIVLRGALHGAGDVRAVMWMTWICQWGLRLPLAYILSGVDIPIPEAWGGGEIKNPFGSTLGIKGLWIGLCTEIVIRCVMYAWRFRSGRWMSAKV